jgi:hypothetical protein
MQTTRRRARRYDSHANRRGADERNRPGAACAANNAKGGAGSWQETDDQATKAMFQCLSSPRYRLDRAPFEIERAEEEQAFAKLVYLQSMAMDPEELVTLTDHGTMKLR